MIKTTPITLNFVEFKRYYDQIYYQKKINEFETTIEEVMGFVEYLEDPLFEDEDEDEDDFDRIDATIKIKPKNYLLERIVIQDQYDKSDTGLVAIMCFDISKLSSIVTDKESNKKLYELFQQAFWKESDSVIELFSMDALYLYSDFTRDNSSNPKPKSLKYLDFYFSFSLYESKSEFDNTFFSSFSLYFPIQSEDKKLTVRDLIEKKGLLFSPILSIIINSVISESQKSISI